MKFWCPINNYKGLEHQIKALIYRQHKQVVDIDVYVTPNSGRTYRTSIFRAFQVNEYGELDQHRSSEGWTTGYYETNNGGIRYHHRHAFLLVHRLQM